MAEFIENNPKKMPISGMDAMGKPIPFVRRAEADRLCKVMGLSNADDRTACINGVANCLERDNPYEAMADGMKYLDLTGTYRLFAVLLTPVAQEITK